MPVPDYRDSSSSIRSLAFLCVYYYEQYDQLKPNYNMNFLILDTFFAGGVSSWSVGDNRSSSIRGLETNPAVKYYFPVLQFGATSVCLYGLRDTVSCFSWPSLCKSIPSSWRFVVKKKIATVSKNTVVTMYGVFSLWLLDCSFTSKCAIRRPDSTVFCVNFAAILRSGPRFPVYVQVHKYLLDLTLGFVLRYIRPIFDKPLSWEILIFCQLMRVSMIALGFWNGYFRDYFSNKKNPVQKSV